MRTVRKVVTKAVSLAIAVSVISVSSSELICPSFSGMSLRKQTQEPGCIAPPAGLVLWWGADNNQLDIVGENHCILRNGATYAQGMVEQAFMFDGNDGYSDVAGLPFRLYH